MAILKILKHDSWGERAIYIKTESIKAIEFDLQPSCITIYYLDKVVEGTVTIPKGVYRPEERLEFTIEDVADIMNLKIDCSIELDKDEHNED